MFQISQMRVAQNGFKKISNSWVDVSCISFGNNRGRYDIEKKSSLIEAMQTVCAEDSVDHVLFFVVDITKESTLFVPNKNVKKWLKNLLV